MFCYCAEARRVSRLLTTRYDAALAPADLTAAQFELLQVLDAVGPANGRSLAQRLAVDHSTLSRNLKWLVQEKYVGTASSNVDARQVLYRVTAAGRRRLQRAQPLWRNVHAAVTSELGGNAESARSLLLNLTKQLGA